MRNTDRDSFSRSYKPSSGETWSCAKCGREIESLPFDPKRNSDGSLVSSVYHRECLPSRGGDRDRGGDRGSFSRSFKPNAGETWNCEKCGGEIESLPFGPRRKEDGSLQSPIYHRECLPPRG